MPSLASSCNRGVEEKERRRVEMGGQAAGFRVGKDDDVWRGRIRDCLVSIFNEKWK